MKMSTFFRFVATGGRLRGCCCCCCSLGAELSEVWPDCWLSLYFWLEEAEAAGRSGGDAEEALGLVAVVVVGELLRAVTLLVELAPGAADRRPRR